jgi:hypothetical protein
MHIHLTAEELRPLVESVVEQVLLRFHSDSDRIAFSETEAAEILGVPRTSLRDDRLRGRISASLVGRRIRYTRQDLLDYLADRKWEPR